MIAIEKVKARTKKDCSQCHLPIFPEDWFVRVGIYPSDFPLHIRCVKEVEQKLKATALEVKRI